MAADLLRHQSSRAYCDNHHSGCMRGLLQFLDLDRHLHKKKMLTYKRHDNEKHGGGTKLLTSEQDAISNDEERLLDKDAKLQMENKITAPRKSSVSTRLINLLYKRITKKRERKLKNSSSASRLLRTFSIHHLECDDYVLPDEMTSDSDSSRDKNSPSVPNTSEELLQDVASMAGIKVDNDERVLNRVTDLKQRIKDVIKEEHRISMDGVLDKVPIGHKLHDYVDREESRGGDSSRSKFGSEGFVYTNSKLAHRSIQRSRSLTESRLLGSSSVREPQRIPQRLNSIKEQDNRRLLRSHSLSESLDRYSHLLEFISVREPQRPPQKLNSIKGQDNNFAPRRVLRSHSLSESFDRYHLLESISVKEPQRLPQRSNSVKDQDNSFEHRRVLHSRSLSESVDRYSRSLESSVREPTRQPERLKSIRDEDGLQDMKSQTACGKMISNPEIGAFSFSNDVPSEVSALSSKKPDSDLSAGDAEVETYTSNQPNSVVVLVNTEESMEADTFIQHTGEPNSVGTLEQPEFINEHEQTEACIVSDDLVVDDSSSVPKIESKDENKEDPSEKPLKPSPVSVLDSCPEEDPVSPAKYAELQGAELQSSWIHFEQQNSGANPENSNSRMVEFLKADSDIRQMTMGDGDINCFLVKEKAEFSYVKDVLKKSGYCEGAEEFLAAWCSSYEPVDQLLFVEEQDDSAEIPFDRQLLLDLMNEVLLEIYESIIACNTGFSRFNSHIRQMPVGDHLLEEVWAKISCHLSSQQDMNYTLEHVEARDYVKNDGWMNLQWDVDKVGVYLQGWILDDLVEEIIQDLEDV